MLQVSFGAEETPSQDMAISRGRPLISFFSTQLREAVTGEQVVNRAYAVTIRLYIKYCTLYCHSWATWPIVSWVDQYKGIIHIGVFQIVKAESTYLFSEQLTKTGCLKRNLDNLSMVN